MSSIVEPVISPWKEGRFLILGMTYPHYSRRYTENVCTGAIDVDTGQLVRIHPVPQRYLEPGHRPRTFQMITCRYRAHDADPRPESIRIEPSSIEADRIISSDERAERRRWLDSSSHLVPSVEVLHDRWRNDHTSLGIVVPRRICGVRLEKRSATEAKEWREKAHRVHRQGRLPGMGTVKPIDFPDMRFMVAWECNDPRCRGHEMGVEEWGIHELWRNLHGDPQQHEKTLDALRRRLDTETGDVYLYLGNFLSIRWNFGLMGVCWIRRDVQMSLF